MTAFPCEPVVLLAMEGHVCTVMALHWFKLKLLTTKDVFTRVFEFTCAIYSFFSLFDDTEKFVYPIL